MVSAPVLIVFIAYLVVLLGLGVWGRRVSGTVEGYYLAEKQLPSWVIAFSANATGESGWLLLGLTGMGYLVGFHALWVVFGEVLGVAVAWLLVARPFKAYSDRYEAITVPDFLEARFRDDRNRLRIVSTVIILGMVTAYLVAQLVATGKAFETFMGTSYAGGVLLGAAITLFYTSVGGYKAVAYTDFVQGLLMAGGLLVLALVGIHSAGGWSSMIETLRATDPALLMVFGQHGWSAQGILGALSFAGIGLGFLAAPQLLTRFMAARDDRQIVHGGFIAIVCIIIFDLGAVFAGIAGRVVFPVLNDPETVMPVMSEELFPALITGLFVVVVTGAIMSTVDSILILASSSVVRDLLQKVLRPSFSDRRLTRYGKMTTIVLGLVAIPFALKEVQVIFWFVLFAWSGLASAFAPVVLCSLFWRRTTLQGALVGMIGGCLTVLIWVVAFKSQFYNLYEMLPGFLVGGALTILVSLLTQPPANIDAEFNAALRRRRDP